MKVGVVSDTHLARLNSSSPTTLSFVKSIQTYFKGVDLILHAGDIGSFEVLSFLKNIAPLKAVYGNMDDLLIRRALPEKLVFEAQGVKIAVCHGSGPPWDITSRLIRDFKEESPDCIVFGHTHEPFNQVVSGILLFNPGSPTDTVYASKNSLGLLHIQGGKIEGEIIEV